MHGLQVVLFGAQDGVHAALFSIHSVEARLSGRQSRDIAREGPPLEGPAAAEGAAREARARSASRGG